MATSFTPNSNPFQGGSFTPGAVPNLNGAIQPAATGGSLIGGVQGSTPMLARNNRGSNVTVPYARVVGHPPANTALPAVDSDKKRNPANATTSYPLMGRPSETFYTETQGLIAGKVAFVLGRRGTKYETGPQTGISPLDITRSGGGQAVPFRTANAVSKFAVGGADVNTMQRMCSFDYLERYFYHVLRKKVIAVGEVGEMNSDNFKNVPPSVRKVRAALQTAKLTSVDAEVILSDMQSTPGGLANDPQPDASGDYSGDYTDLDNATNIGAELINSGIFLQDEGPFLRGKTLERGTVKVGKNKMRVPLSIGDDLAFDRFEELLAEVGALDWQPDGLVHSKLSQGDVQLDEELDARDGMLFNVTVQGPSITTSWSEDKRKATLPLDKVFVVIVGDVWYGKTKEQAEAVWAADANPAGDSYETARGTTEKTFHDNSKAYFTDATSFAAITNMRVKLMTSSEMISYSSVADGRLELKKFDNASQYIVGGWCIGTVLDNAAARSSHEGVALMGAVKRGRTSNGINVSVKVEWWSPDRMYRSFMNVGSQIRTRYTGVTPESFRGTGSEYATASQRVAVAAAATTATPAQVETLVQGRKTERAARRKPPEEEAQPPEA